MKQMMSDKIEKVLKAVYRKRGTAKADTPALNPMWRANALRKIRTLPIDPPLFWLFQQYIWRLAPVACILILAMGLWLIQGGLNPELDMAALALDNPVGVHLLASFGM